MTILNKIYRFRGVFKHISVFILFSMFPFVLSAAEVFSLEQAISLSLKNNTSLKISAEKVRASRLKVIEAWGGLWPKLSTDVSYTPMWAESGMNSNIEAQCNINFISGQLTINPGSYYHTLKSSYKGHVAAENDVRTVKANIVITTIQLYYQILLADEMIELRENSIKALEENLRVVTAGYNKGTFSKLDLLRAQVALSNERTKLINARNNALTAKASLNIHLGREIHTILMLDKRALDVNVESLEFKDGDELKEQQLVRSMIGDALKNRPELLQLKYIQESTDHAAKALQSVYLWPSIFVQGSYGTSQSFKKDSGTGSTNPATAAIIEAINNSVAPKGWNDSWSITLGASYQWGSLLPFDTTHAKASQVKSQKKQADLQFEEFIKQVKLDVQQKFLKLKSASYSIYSQQGNIQIAEEALRVSIMQFRSGIIDNSKLLEANVELATARTLFIEALHNYQVARAELNRAIGRDYFDIK